MSTSQAAHAVAMSAAAARALLQSLAEIVADEDTAEIIVDTETELPAAIAAALDRIDELEANATAIDARIASLKERKSRFVANIDTLRRSIQSALEATNMRKIELPSATIGLRAVPASLVIVDEAALPREFLRVPPAVPDKAAIKAALAAGVDVSGAQMSNGGQTVVFKRT